MDISKNKHISELGNIPNSENKDFLKVVGNDLERLKSSDLISSMHDKLDQTNKDFEIADDYDYTDKTKGIISDTINTRFIFGYGFEKGAIDPREYIRKDNNMFRFYGYDTTGLTVNKYEIPLIFGYGITSELLKVRSNNESIKKIQFELKEDAEVNILFGKYVNNYIPIDPWGFDKINPVNFSSKRIIFKGFPGKAGMNEIIIDEEYDFMFQIYNNEYIIIESSNEDKPAILMASDYIIPNYLTFGNTGLISTGLKKPLILPLGRWEPKRINFYAETVERVIKSNFTKNNIDINAGYVDSINRVYNNGAYVSNPSNFGVIYPPEKYTKQVNPEYHNITVKLNKNKEGIKIDRIISMVPDGLNQIANNINYYSIDDKGNIYKSVSTSDNLISAKGVKNILSYETDQVYISIILPKGADHYATFENHFFENDEPTYQWFSGEPDYMIYKKIVDPVNQNIVTGFEEIRMDSLPVIFEMSEVFVDEDNLYNETVIRNNDWNIELDKIKNFDRKLEEEIIPSYNEIEGKVEKIDNDMIFNDTTYGVVKLKINSFGNVTWEQL